MFNKRRVLIIADIGTLPDRELTDEVLHSTILDMELLVNGQRPEMRVHLEIAKELEFEKCGERGMALTKGDSGGCILPKGHEGKHKYR